MSSVQTDTPTFFDLYSRREIAADQIEDFVDRWHTSGAEEERPLAAFLGLADEEYAVILMDPNALPRILSARRNGWRLADAMADYVGELSLSSCPADRAVAYALLHWLRDRSGSV